MITLKYNVLWSIFIKESSGILVQDELNSMVGVLLLHFKCLYKTFHNVLLENLQCCIFNLLFGPQDNDNGSAYFEASSKAYEPFCGKLGLIHTDKVLSQIYVCIPKSQTMTARSSLMGSLLSRDFL